ncbi:MAG: cyclic nucleotide-binding domain-containing protein [Chloroflexota bacterium]
MSLAAVKHTAVEAPKSLTKFITHTDFYKALDSASVADLEQELQWVCLDQTETLFQQGTSGNGLYVVVSGRLGIVITQPDGTPTSPDALTRGSVVGEMGLFTGQTPIRVLYAIEKTKLVKLPKVGFDRLVEKHPNILTKFSQYMTPRLRSVQLASAFDRLFGPFSERALMYLEKELDWLHISNGDILVRQGDTDDSLYIVISGSLSVLLEESNKPDRILAEISRGESIGELSLLTGEVRSATVRAIRDTVVVRLTKASFDHLIDTHPEAMVEVTRLIIQRYQKTIGATTRAAHKTATIAVVPAGQNAPLSNFAHQLAIGLGKDKKTLHLNSQRFDALLSKSGAAQTSRDDPTSMALETWLSEQETNYHYIIYEVDPDWTNWTQRCIRNADRILFVGAADSNPTLSKIERRLHQMPTLAVKELILLHQASTDRPRDTRKWLERRDLRGHHHLRINHNNDLQRLVRHLTGKSIGLVLSGGAAKAFAHIGVIKALNEAGIAVDMVGGASLGSVVAAAYALNWDYAKMVQAARTFFSRTKIFDYTFPAVSIANSKKMTRTLSHEFEGIQIEDMWLPYFCVSSNLTRAKQMIHRQGDLWRGLRSSCSIPGVFTPMVDGMDLLVDGAVLNNMPVDVMYDMCEGGTVIAVDVSSETELADDYDFVSYLSGWRVLWGKLNPLMSQVKAPSLMGTLKRVVELNSVRQRRRNIELADVFIDPAVEKFGLADFDAYQELIDIGYGAAQQPLQHWLAEQVELEKLNGHSIAV